MILTNHFGHAGVGSGYRQHEAPSRHLGEVRLFNGPGNNGESVRNGVTCQLKAGDVVIIPAGTGHWFTKIDDHISYVMVRIDPDKATPLMDAAASIFQCLLSRSPKAKTVVCHSNRLEMTACLANGLP